MNEIELAFTWPTFGMALAGLLLHFLGSWGDFWRNPTTLRIGPLAYLRLDPPAWVAAVIGTVAFYFALPEIGAVTGASMAIGVTPLWSLAAGYMGSSMSAKILGILAGRVGVR